MEASFGDGGNPCDGNPMRNDIWDELLISVGYGGASPRQYRATARAHRARGAVGQT